MDFYWAEQRSRSAIAIARKVVRTEKAEAQPRSLGRFTKTAPTLLQDRSAAERARKREELLQTKFDEYISESIEQIATLQAQHSQALANLDS
jgi:hypothetical protein